MTIDRYLELRRWVEALFWFVFLSVIFVCNVAVRLYDLQRSAASTASWEPVLWEGSSMLAIALLLPWLFAFDRRYPLRWQTLLPSVSAHAIGSVVFSVLHVSFMVALRKIVYAAKGSHYDFGSVLPEFAYEYLKDFRAYALLLGIAYLYRFILLRLQGEASLPQEEESAEAAREPDYPQRLLVKKLGREFLVQVKEIDYIEAAGNYLNLHVKERVYPLRETMTRAEQTLDPAQFCRVHRSYMVNINAIAEIENLNSGDATLKLKSGVLLPLSRNFKNALREQGKL